MTREALTSETPTFHGSSSATGGANHRTTKTSRNRLGRRKGTSTVDRAAAAAGTEVSPLAIPFPEATDGRSCLRVDCFFGFFGRTACFVIVLRVGGPSLEIWRS